MRKFIEKWLHLIVGIGGFALIIAVQFAFATDLTLTNDVIIGVDSPKTAIIKLEGNDDELLTFINDLKDGYASSAAPSSPNEGQLWYDNLNEEMKQYHGATWVTQWSYADTTTIVWEGNLDGDTIDANSGTIDNLEASTISAPYATLTDVDVVSAEIGSATIGTLSTSNWSQDTATFSTLVVTGRATIPFRGALISLGTGNITITDESSGTMIWDQAEYDIDNFDDIGGSNPDRLTITSADISYVTLKAQLALGSDSTGSVDNRAIIYLQKNGVNTFPGGFYWVFDELDFTGAAALYTANLVSSVISVSQNDYFNVIVYWIDNTGTDALVVDGDANGRQSWFSVEVIE